LSLVRPYASAASESAFKAAIVDPDPLVRSAALRVLPIASPRAIIQAAAALLSDPVRVVRVEALRALAGTDLLALTPEQQTAFVKATAELVTAEMVDADRAEAHLNLGLLDLRRRELPEAEGEFRAALRLDPNFVRPSVRRREYGGAMDLMRRAQTLAPDCRSASCCWISKSAKPTSALDNRSYRETVEFGQDSVGGFGPDKRVGAGVVPRPLALPVRAVIYRDTEFDPSAEVAIVASVGLHPVVRVLDFCPRYVERCLHEIAREIGDGSIVADPSEAGCNRDIGRSHGIAAEDQSLFDQPVPDAFRPDRKGIGRDKAPAPSPIDNRSGIRNNERTPPTSTTELASRGNPRSSWPISVVVPPRS
jgi:hypothetical protein